MFREGETALCLSEEGDLWDGSDNLLFFVREKSAVYERGRGTMG